MPPAAPRIIDGIEHALWGGVISLQTANDQVALALRKSADKSHFDLALHKRLMQSPTTDTLSSALDVTHTTRTIHLPCESIRDTRGYRDVVTHIKPESAEALERLTNKKIQHIARPHVIVTWGNNVGFIHQEQMWPPNIAQLCYGKKQWDFWSPFATVPVRSVEYLIRRGFRSPLYLVKPFGGG